MHGSDPHLASDVSLLGQASHQTEDAQEAAWLQPEVASMQSHDTELRLRLWSKGLQPSTL